MAQHHRSCVLGGPICSAKRGSVCEGEQPGSCALRWRAPLCQWRCATLTFTQDYQHVLLRGVAITLATYTACHSGAPAACGAGAAAPSMSEVGFCMGFCGQRCRHCQPSHLVHGHERLAFCQVSGLGRSNRSGSAQMCPVFHWPECFPSLGTQESRHLRGGFFQA